MVPSTSTRNAANGWSGTTFGDVYAGVKFNILSEYAQAPVALGIRGVVKLPTGDDDFDKGTSSGKPDFLADVIVSKEINKAFELSGYGGFIVRGQGDIPVNAFGTDRSRTAYAGASASPCRRAARCG